MLVGHSELVKHETLLRAKNQYWNAQFTNDFHSICTKGNLPWFFQFFDYQAFPDPQTKMFQNFNTCSNTIAPFESGFVRSKLKLSEE